MNYIPRAIEQYVEHSAKTFKCVLLTGARQTGKSTTLKQLFPSYKYVPLDDPFVEDQAKENPDMFFMLNPPPLFLDEVQRTPGLFRYLKMKCDENNERGRFLLSGSQPLELMESASESLSGRVCIAELSGLSLREISRDAFNEPFVPTLEYITRRILHPIEIKKNAKVTADETAAFAVLDQVPDKTRGDGALICLCPQPGKLRENVFQVPVWFI